MNPRRLFSLPRWSLAAAGLMALPAFALMPPDKWVGVATKAHDGALLVGLGPGLGQQPDTAPEATREQRGPVLRQAFLRFTSVTSPCFWAVLVR